MNDFVGCADRGRQKRRATSEDKEKYVSTDGLLGHHNTFRHYVKRMNHYGWTERGKPCEAVADVQFHVTLFWDM
jgi:hypothetical protein